MILRLCLLLCLLLSPAVQAEERQTLRIAQTDRHFLLRLPAELATTPVPLVIVLHGGGGNARSAERMTGFSELGARAGFAVVYPEGSGRFGDRLLTWNAGHCCGHAMHNRVDDVAFISALIDHLVAHHRIDPRRIYVTGMSNGGMMAHRLGRELSQRIAAIAPVVAALFGDEAPAPNPVAALIINGEQDRSVPFAGGPPGGRFAGAWDGTPTQPASAQASYWAKANGCDPLPRSEQQEALTRWQYRCPSGRAVTLLALADNGHAWPGGQRGTARADPPSQSLNASETIWQFFRQYSR